METTLNVMKWSIKILVSVKRNNIIQFIVYTECVVLLVWFTIPYHVMVISVFIETHPSCNESYMKECFGWVVFQGNCYDHV